MTIVRTAAELGPHAGGILVPTMGGLHAGHGALVARAAEIALGRGDGASVVVSVFVNPTQFNERADFDRYPRDVEADSALIRRYAGGYENVVVFAPDVGEVYPPGVDVPVGPLPAAATGPGLEDRFRPGHFEGVCQVVRRLFMLTSPADAVFGEKDWQQLCVVRAMVRDEGLGIDIHAGETVREPDGLAMSSRNRFLRADERERAAAVSRALRTAAGVSAEAGGVTVRVAAAERAMRETLESAGLSTEYAVVRDAATLRPVIATDADAPKRAVIAARLGAVRLIDNAPWA